MGKKIGLLVGILVIVGAICGGVFMRLPNSTNATNAVSRDQITGDYQEALDVIDSNYVNEVKYESEAESSNQGMLWTLDPHSSFFTKEEFRKLNEDQQSKFFGIGVSILQHHDGVYVQAVVPGTPAQKVGLKFGDRFVEVDGKDASKWTSQELSKNVRGERGTLVHVKIERAGAEKPIEFEITRDGVPLPSIRNTFMLKDDIGYIGLTGGFQETTEDELTESLATLKKQGMKQLILDLRNNPGGILPQAIDVVSHFIPKGQVVVSVKGRSRYAKSEDLRAVGGTIEDCPLIVMINSGSASASEIVSGALQDYERALIVGNDSFGKGLVQRVFQLPMGTGLTLTMARYYTPFGRSLQRDYSNGSIYEYYTHQQSTDQPKATESESAPKPQGSPVTTANGRVLYGGRGIEPDVKVDGLVFTQVRYRIMEAAFFFVRQVVAQRMPGLEDLKVDQPKPDHILQPDELIVNDKIFNAFRAFTTADKKSGLNDRTIDENIEYAKTRIRQELATATYSTEAGSQALLVVDPQVLKSIEVMPDAKKMQQTFMAN